MTVPIIQDPNEVEKFRSIFDGKRELRKAAIADGDLDQANVIGSSIVQTIREMIRAGLTFDDLRTVPYTGIVGE